MLQLCPPATPFFITRGDTSSPKSEVRLYRGQHGWFLLDTARVQNLRVYFQSSSRTRYILKHWEVSCPLLASIIANQWEPVWYLREWHSEEENKEGQGAIKTLCRSSLRSLCSLCITKVTLLRAPGFFYQVWRLGLAFVPLIITDAVKLAMKSFFVLLYMFPISLYQTNDYLLE